MEKRYAERNRITPPSLRRRRPRRLTHAYHLLLLVPPLRKDDVEARAEVVRHKGQHGIDTDTDDGAAGQAQRARDARGARRKEARQGDGAYRDAGPRRQRGVTGPWLAQHVVDGRDGGRGASRGDGAGDAVECRRSRRGRTGFVACSGGGGGGCGCPWPVETCP